MEPLICALLAIYAKLQVVILALCITAKWYYGVVLDGTCVLIHILLSHDQL